SSRRRHTRSTRDWSSDVCSSDLANEAAAISALRTLATAEITYSVAYPNHGYTCSLWDLDGFGSSETSEHHAMLIDSGLATGKKEIGRASCRERGQSRVGGAPGTK